MRGLLNLPPDTLRTICGQVVEAAPKSVAAMKLGRFVRDTTEVAGVLSAAQTQTAFLDTMPQQEDSDFSFDELATGRATIYLVIPATQLRDNGRWLRLMVSMAIRAVARIRASLDLPVLFLLDEFGTVGRLEVVENAYGLMRGFGIAVWAFLQDLNQLSQDYPEIVADLYRKLDGYDLLRRHGPIHCRGHLEDARDRDARISRRVPPRPRNRPERVGHRLGVRHPTAQARPKTRR